MLEGHDRSHRYPLYRCSPRPVIGSTHGGQHYLSEVLDLAAKGKVKPITETFPLDRATEAYDRLASGKMRFRGVFTPAQS
ncbi:zinc-binding dehydrogenase (plasmid) [Streptomyces sp. NBC_01426]